MRIPSWLSQLWIGPPGYTADELDRVVGNTVGGVVYDVPQGVQVSGQPTPEQITRAFRDMIHLVPTTGYEENIGWRFHGWDVFKEVTRWRALPAPGFEPATYDERNRCPEAATPLAAYTARLILLMAEHGYTAEQRSRTVAWLSTRREANAIARVRENVRRNLEAQP